MTSRKCLPCGSNDRAALCYPIGDAKLPPDSSVTSWEDSMQRCVLDNGRTSGTVDSASAALRARRGLRCSPCCTGGNGMRKPPALLAAVVVATDVAGEAVT